MKERSFTLKSYRKGLALHIKPEAEMETLLVQLTEKFRSSRAFFGNLQVGLALSGRELTQEEEDAVLDVIEENSDLQIVCLIGKDEKIQYLLDEALEENTPPAQEEAGPDGQFYRGTLRKGQSLDTEHSVIILGDVNQGARIFSRKDVIVLGALLGEVHAGVGAEDKSHHFVCALEFSPEKLKIGSYKYKKKPEKRLWPDSYKKSPKIAALQGEEIIVKPVTKELLGQIIVTADDQGSQ
jgi:septum site-determining protein MinC